MKPKDKTVKLNLDWQNLFISNRKIFTLMLILFLTIVISITVSVKGSNILLHDSTVAIGKSKSSSVNKKLILLDLHKSSYGDSIASKLTNLKESNPNLFEQVWQPHSEKELTKLTNHVLKGDQALFFKQAVDNYRTKRTLHTMSDAILSTTYNTFIVCIIALIFFSIYTFRGLNDKYQSMTATYTFGYAVIKEIIVLIITGVGFYSLVTNNLKISDGIVDVQAITITLFSLPFFIISYSFIGCYNIFTFAKANPTV